MTDLLLCPFCGGIARAEKEKRYFIAHEDDPDAWAHFVICNSCAAQGGWAKTPGNAVRNWNMRMQPNNPMQATGLAPADASVQSLSSDSSGEHGGGNPPRA